MACYITSPEVNRKLIWKIKKMPIRQQKKYLYGRTVKKDSEDNNIYMNTFSKSAIFAVEKGIKKLSPKKRHRKKKLNLNQALRLINKIWCINNNVKENAYETFKLDYCRFCGNTYSEEREIQLCPNHDFMPCTFYHTEVDYQLRDKEYAKKTRLLRVLVSGILQNDIPINVWKNNGVIYFEYEGKQVSFHDPKNKVFAPKKNWKWSKNKNTTLPFPEVE